MESVFLHLLNMSVTAGWLVLAVVVLRLVFRRAPKWIHCLLWVLVAVRLLCPVSIESALSLIPSTETVPVDTFLYDTPAIHSGVPVVDAVVNPVISNSFAPRPGDSVNPMQVVSILAAYVWVLGMVAMVLYALISTLRLRRRVREAAYVRENIWQCDRIATPFILGVFRPRIYLPTLLGAEEARSVVAHERAHLARRDHWWKPLGFLLLTVYWFNPLLWLGYVLLCRDIEAACDQRVVRDMDTDGRREYSRVLLACSAPRHVIAACPLAFGETGVKTRIKSVLHYKKPAFWLVITALVATVVAAVCLLTNPRTSIPTDMDAFLSQAILDYNRSEHTGDDYPTEAHTVFGSRKVGGNTAVYGMVLYEEYYVDENDVLQTRSGSHCPTILTVGKDAAGNYTLVDYWIPRDGENYPKDIRDRFPARHQGKALDIDGYYEKHRAATLAQAQSHFHLLTLGEALSADTYTASLTFSSMNHLSEEKNAKLYANLPATDAIQYLPVIPMTDRGELDAFIAEYKKDMNFDLYRYGETPIDQMSVYDDAFFAEHVLLAVYYADGSCSVEPKIGGLIYGVDALQVQVDVYEPEAGDTALGQWFMLCEVARSAIPDEPTYTAVVRSRIPMYDSLEIAVTQAVLSENRNEGGDHIFHSESHRIYGVKENEYGATVYALVYYQEYAWVDGTVVERSGSLVPTVITFQKNVNTYDLLEYWTPGTEWGTDIRQKFPAEYVDQALDYAAYPVDEMKLECLTKAYSYWGVEGPDNTDEHTFTGRVTQVTSNGKQVLMDCYDTDKFTTVWVSLRNVNGVIPIVGEEYTVIHTGLVQETYPPQVTAIRLIPVSSTPLLLETDPT